MNGNNTQTINRPAKPCKYMVGKFQKLSDKGYPSRQGERWEEW